MEAIKSKLLTLKYEIEELQDKYDIKVIDVNESIREREMSEIELIGKQRKIKILQDAIERMESKLDNNLKLTKELNATTIEYDGENSCLSETNDSNIDKVENLILEVKSMVEESTKAEMKCIEASQKLISQEEKVRIVTQKAVKAEFELENLCQEINNVSSNLQNLQQLGHEKGAKEEEYEATLNELNEELRKVESQNDSMERSIKKINRDIEVTKSEIEIWKNKSEELDKGMESFMIDINDL